MSESLPPEYFDRLYSTNPDPWDFASSPYEAEKYRRTLDSLPRDHYDSVLEIGCSIGILTSQLAARCGRLLSIDVSEAALQSARVRCAGIPNVSFEHLAVPHEFPPGCFDLTVVSEVGYYLGYPDLAKLGSLLEQHSAPNGQLILVHWLPFVEDYPLTGDQVHEYFLSLPHWECLTHFRAPQYRLELLQKRPEHS
jgi:cyclopropane fatty-acyl-phospholipid synthase-like methyltransferase